MHIFPKTFNKNNVTISYCCIGNIWETIKKQCNKTLNSRIEVIKNDESNCRNNGNCPSITNTDQTVTFTCFFLIQANHPAKATLSEFRVHWQTAIYSTTNVFDWGECWVNFSLCFILLFFSFCLFIKLCNSFVLIEMLI